MASEIISETLDAAYPVAGVDNDTQGFRDNFSIIKTGLGTAKNEITILQSNTAKLDESNNFNGNVIASAELSLSTHSSRNPLTINSGSSNLEISFLEGHYQTIALGADATFMLTDWPVREGVYVSKMTVEFKSSDESQRTITINSESNGIIKKSLDFPTTLTVASNNTSVIVEFWTATKGNTVFANYIGEFS